MDTMTEFTPLEREWMDLCGWPMMPGRNALPGLVYDLYEEGTFDGRDDLLAWALYEAFSSAEFPCRQVDVQDWERWFEQSGFTINGLKADRPSTIPTLYRASMNEEFGDPVHGLSWTDDLEKAKWFHARNQRLFVGEGQAYLLAVEPEPWMLLAQINGESNRNEAEWVLSSEAYESARMI